MKFNLILFIFLLSILCDVRGALKEFYRWKQIKYSNLPSYVLTKIPYGFNFAKYADVTSYIPYNNIPIGVSHWNGKLFISVARRNYGIPSTLNVIDIAKVPREEPSPDLIGYPNYLINAIPAGLRRHTDRIISVYRTRVDSCNRLWFVDTGLLEYPDNFIQVQRPSIWVIDLTTNIRLRRFEIPERVARLGDGFISITVDVDPNSCEKAFAYIPNLRTFSLSVYSFETNQLWTFGHNYFYLEPHNGDFNLNGLRWRWNDGIFSVALGPFETNGYRTAYFHAFSSLSEYKVSTAILQNSTLASDAYQQDGFQYIGYRGDNMQCAVHDIDINNGIMIFGVNQKNAVGCWNINKPFHQSNFDQIGRNDITMVYPSDVKVDQYSQAWVITNKIPFYVYGKLNVTDYNFRIWTNNVLVAVGGTKCRPQFVYV